MRILPIILAFIPYIAMADDIALSSDVTAVTLYPSGATIIREVPFSAPAGQHDLILTDLPRDTPLDSVRVSVTGAAMGSVTVRNDFVPPRGDDTDAAIKAAEAKVEQLEQALRDGRAGVEAIRLEDEAAAARVAFLQKLGEGDGIEQLGVAALRDLVGMIGDETLTAIKAGQNARLRADAAERDLKDLREDLDQARQALKALVPEVEARAMLVVSVSGPQAIEGALTITYNIWGAEWQPIYDVKLDRASGALDIERGAFVAQSSGENWTDVALTLSTVRPSERTAPGEIGPWQRWIEDPVQPDKRRVVQSLGAVLEMNGAVMPALMEADAMASAEFDGLAVTYSYPEPVTIASNADNLRIALGTLSTKADVVARAVPLMDGTAYLIAQLRNDMGELILPGQMMLYMDGRYIGQSQLGLIPAGGEADLGFGPIEGLQLSRTVLNRNEGDRGLISKSSELSEEVLIEVENLTGEPWAIELIDRVPFSEQEDLEISWGARPRPDTQDVDGQRGVLQWDFDLPAGEVQKITLNHTLEWPDGKILR
ncbi:hypothetical protein MNBD_ALPHA07-1240 [hydrothermal vent metagenome]|uniref:Aspartate ammonia-lyase n=1 Tax=hydrothermal vent metagenome TaxID=652676 RepID=A0A3B0SMX5_9ZZZZ